MEQYIHQTKTIGAVSYTHLDVYKRQLQDNQDNIIIIIIMVTVTVHIQEPHTHTPARRVLPRK